MADRTPLLKVSEVTKSFGGITAVENVSFEVEPGESLGLVGPNGAGKTTLFNCICGQSQPQRGSVQLAGVELLNLPTYKRARKGIGRTYQRVEIFPDMTVRDHLLVAERASRRQGRLWKDLCNRSAPTAEEAHRVAEVLELVGIQNQADAPVSSLGLGSCRLVELARALVADPVLLLADEPSSGLDIHETRELSQVLQMLQRERGMAVLLVEHDLSMVASVVDRAIVMNLGAVIAVGTFDEVMADPSVRHAYLGVGRVTAVTEHRDGQGGDTAPLALEIDHVSASYGPYRALFDVTFSVPSRGVTALIGSNGAGKSTVSRVVTGLVASTSGSIRLDGRDITGLPAYKIARAGTAHVPEGRGIFASLTVEENLRLVFRQRGGRKCVAQSLARAYEAFPVLGQRRGQHGGTLSGGEQRMLSLAKVLVLPPQLLVADEISLGLAPVVIDAVYDGLREINRAGTALLVVEQQVDRVLELASTAVVLEHGSVAYSGEPGGALAAVEEVMASRGERTQSQQAKTEEEETP